jgi:sugar/nucleoside kinase (ribokinase family)
VRVEDTTGAGDAFRGGFVSAWLRFGPEAELHTLLEYANAVAALNCLGLGAQTALPGRDAVDALVTGTYRDQSK